MMTKRERLGKEQLVRTLAQEGYVTYSNLFELFDLHLTKDPEVIGYMVPEEAVICVNENLDLDQVGVIVRHEILHEFLNHHKRAQAHDPKGDHQTFNIAGDYEISNLGYTDRDKAAVRAIRLGDQILTGLVTDYDHPDWVDKSYEQMYDLLKKLQKEDPNAQKMPQIGNRGNQQIQDAEDAQRRAEQVSDAADSMAGGSGSSQASGKKGQNQDQEGGGGGSGEDGQDQENKPQGGAGGGQDGDKKKRNKYDDEEYANMSPEEKKKERARRRKEAAKKLKEEADKLIDDLKDILNEGKNQGGGSGQGNSTSGGPGSKNQVFDTPEEQAERGQRIAKIREILRDLEKGQQALDETRSVVLKEKAVKAAKDAHRYRDNALTRFTESLNKFIRNAIARSRNSSWAHINKKYVNSGLLRPGTSMSARGKVPLIIVYFDRSGSWDAQKTEKGRQAISTLNKYVTRGEIKMKLKYFNTSVHDTDPGGGGTNGQPILEDIAAEKPDNVIILTDSDISDCRTPTEVPGAVWLLWYGGRSQNLADHIKGKQLTKEFKVE